MNQGPSDPNSKPQIISSPRPFFSELVESAVVVRKIKAPAATQSYIVDLLEHYMLSGNLFAGQPTLAEQFLTAQQAEPNVRAELLKRLGDTSLYISGFFGDSLHRKLVDLDYYADLGGTAYGTLAANGAAEVAPVFGDLSQRFLEYVELLTFISQQSLVQTNEDLLRLYNRYLTTGSKLAAEQLREKGVLASPIPLKAVKQ